VTPFGKEKVKKKKPPELSLWRLSVSVRTEIYGAPLTMVEIMKGMKTTQHAWQGVSRMLCCVASRN
jgi:hypothetical protein